MRDLALWTSEVLDITSFAVILLGVAISTAVFLVRVWQTGFLANYRDYRANLGRGILIGLELLIAADILKSVVVDPTLQGIAVLGGIVADPHLPVDLARRRDQRPLAVGDDAAAAASRHAATPCSRPAQPSAPRPRRRLSSRPSTGHDLTRRARCRGAAMILFGMIAYVLAQFAVGIWVSRRVKSESDYILAGRSLGPTLVAFSVFATWFGAEAIVATTAEVYDKGISGALVDPLAYGLAVVAAGFLYAAVLWRKGVTTFADVFRERFSPGVEKLVVIILLPGSVFWAAAQIRAFGQVLSSSSDMSLSNAIILAAVLVASYSVIGGLLADSVTDFLQGTAVIIGLVVLTIAVIVAAGGVAPALEGMPADHLVLATQAHGTPLELTEAVAVAFFGSFVAIELISRFLGARSADVARGGTVTGGAMYIVIGMLPVFLGLAASGLVQTQPGAASKAARLRADRRRSYRSTTCPNGTT